ncbi:MAG: ribonuclease [Miltoncostaeaceae bacterium]|nr:ribonuclease [Miltoncostaeaceae bacterium]
MLTHRSWAPSRERSYERLEFLGDSVLQLVVTAELFRRHPDAPEGELTWMRQQVVGGEACAAAARAGGLPEAFVAAAPAAAREEARLVAVRQSVQAALVEALIGACWLDLGAEEAERTVLEAFGPALDSAERGGRDPKTALQEAAARRRLAVRYELAGSTGPAHARIFETRVLVGDRPLGIGSGPSKQASEQAAAAMALRELGGAAAGEPAPC